MTTQTPGPEYTQPSMPHPVSPAPITNGQPPPMIGYIVRQQTSSMAVTSLVLGIIGFMSAFCTFGIPSALAIIFGHIALKETAGGKKEGHGMAVAGLILGYFVVLPALIISIMLVTGGLIGAFTPSQP